MARLDAARVDENAARVREEIADAARRAGRDPADVELLAAVKYVAPEDLGALVDAGLTLFGENRAQQLEAKAALHCGWRGLASGIVAEGVEALREVGGAGPVTAAIGPGARGCCYEVGEERHAEFAGVPGARVGERNLDLPAIARHFLHEAGVETVHDTGLCTICAGEELFFSHRRDKGVTGRQGGVVWRA